MNKDIIGINLGSKNTIIGAYQSGIFKLIKENSQKSIPTVVSFNDNERNYGELALKTNSSNLKCTIIYPNRWLGFKKDWIIKNEESKYSYIEPTENQLDKVGFLINYKNKNEIYTPECLMGFFFSKLKNIWLTNGINTNQLVISIPDYCLIHERKAMLEAIKIAGLQCSGILNESSAVTLAYAFQKMKEFDENKPRIVSFIDLGHSSCNIFFSKFNKKTVEVISVSSERFCGTREFDYLIALKLSEYFEKKYGSNPMKDIMCKIRLIDNINKKIKLLDENNEIIISIDSLMNNEDLEYKLTKEEFEKIIEPIVKKFENLCKNAIKNFEKKTKLKLSDVHSFEMIGKAANTPIILETIKKLTGKEVSKALVPDEYIARGCIIFEMMISPYFHINNLDFNIYNPFDIVMEFPYKKGKEIIYKKYNLIKAGDEVPAHKTITFSSSQLPDQENLLFKFYYGENPKLEWLQDKRLIIYNIHLPKKIREGKDWKLSLKYILDSNFFHKLEEATLILKKTEMVEDNNNSKMKEKIIETQTNLNIDLVEMYYGTPKVILEQYIYREKILSEENKNNNSNYEINEDIISNFKQEPIAVIFKSIDQKITYPVAGYNSDKFSKFEEKLFNEFPELKNKNIYYIINGNVVDKLGNLKDNKIKNGTNILINYID